MSTEGVFQITLILATLLCSLVAGGVSAASIEQTTIQPDSNARVQHLFSR